MAEKRMISKSISVSEKVNIGLTNNFSRLLYSWIIPHTDDFGRMPGSPAKIKALVIPMLDETKNDVELAIQEMHDTGLINWYEVDGQKYIQIRNFEEHQSGLHKRTSSKFPEPPRTSRNFPEIPLEGKGTEEKRTEQEEKGIGREKNAHQTHLRELLIICKIDGVGIDGLETVYSYIGQVELEVIEKAIKKSEGKHIRYFMKIMNGWIEEGKTRLEDIEPKPIQRRFQNKQKPYIPIMKPTKDEPLSDEEIEEIKKMADKLKEEPA